MKEKTSSKVNKPHWQTLLSGKPLISARGGESSSRAGTASEASSCWTQTALFHPAFIAPPERGWAVYVACSSVLDPVEIVSDEVGLAGVRLWLCVFYARHDSWGQMFGFTKETM